MTKYGYIRISTKSQESNYSLQTQMEELIRFGILSTNIYQEVASATESDNRPVFSKLVNEILKPGDLLVVTKLDRCSRNTLEFLSFQKKLLEQNIQFQSLDLPHSKDPAVTKLISTTLAAIATFETERRKERQKEGIELAKLNGKYKGRKSVITPSLISQVKNYKEVKQLSVTEIAKLTQHSRSVIYKILKTELGYQSNRLIKLEKNKY